MAAWEIAGATEAPTADTITEWLAASDLDATTRRHGSPVGGGADGFAFQDWRPQPCFNFLDSPSTSLSPRSLCPQITTSGEAKSKLLEARGYQAHDSADHQGGSRRPPKRHVGGAPRQSNARGADLHRTCTDRTLREGLEPGPNHVEVHFHRRRNRIDRPFKKKAAWSRPHSTSDS